MNYFKKLNTNKILLFCIFFPFIGFIEGADTQPTLVVVTIILFLFNKIKFRAHALVIGSAILLPFLLRMIFEVNEVNLRYIIIPIILTVNIILILSKIEQFKILITSDFLIVITSIYVVVGLIQIVWPEFLTFLTPRGMTNSSIIMESGRGLKSLTNEPSHFGKLIITFNLLYHLTDKKSSLRSSLIFFLINFLLARSLYMIAMHLGLILFLHSRLKIVLGLSLVSLIVIQFREFLLPQESRISFLVDLIFNNKEGLMKQGAFARLYNIPISINNLVANFNILGYGNSERIFSTEIKTFFGTYSYIASKRNLGGFIEVLLRLGILSIPFFFLYINTIIRIISKFQKEGLGLALIILMLTLNDGSITNPLSILIILLTLSYANRSYSRS